MIGILLAIAQVLVLVLLILIWKNKKLSSSSSVKKGKSRAKKAKKWKLENWVVFGIYLIVGLILIYVLGSTYLPKSFENVNSGDYSVSLENPTNNLRALHFSKDIFGDFENDSVLIESENIVDLVFKPKLILEKGREAEVYIEGRNLGTEVYLDDKLVIPDLSNYEKIEDFYDSEVWVRKDLDKGSYSEAESVEDFVYFNFPGASVYSFKELDKGVPILTDWTNEETEIDTTFRGDLKLAVYHGGGNLNIEFVKQDLNGYTGKDEYTLNIIDFSDGKTLFSKTYEDDGDKKDSKELGDEDDYELNIGLDRGIYYLEWKKDGNNKAADVTLKEIKIGSNKVLIVGRMLVYEEEQEFFTKANVDKKIKFNYWWDSKYQKVYFTGDSRFTENIDKDWKSKDYTVDLEKGSYNFRIEKGYIWVKGDAFSVDENSWFDLPTEGEKKLMSDNDVLIIGHDNYIIDGESVFVRVPVEIKGETSKFKFQVLDGDRFYLENLEAKI